MLTLAPAVSRDRLAQNGPRAGINANDGFGGGDEIAHNLVFSTCRESGDHGPFNSWDRQPFLTTVRDGSPSMIMAWRHIHHNFFIDVRERSTTHRTCLRGRQLVSWTSWERFPSASQPHLSLTCF